MDVGRKFMNRIFVYSSTFFGMYLFYVIMLLLSYFGIVSFRFSNIINAIALFDVGIILTIVVVMLNYGAIVNY
jgi:hypothetical protein